MCRYRPPSPGTDQGRGAHTLQAPRSRGHYRLDVWRLATSLALVARENGGFSLANQKVRAIALDCAGQVALDYASFCASF
ncbi:hypothetical protein [Sorangium sp. So ce128]|uniref:hypothetical protein n=1 Tax=Sorangium sp. So ce128 TaxID=3133281 RepID=UPI003F61098C